MNTISDRQQRYENRCLQQKYRDQKVDRNIRYLARESMQKGIRKEVENEMIYIKKTKSKYYLRKGRPVSYRY
tara:strand:- start:669 stop:884 length:216 start_codon:yes stop_codon:yes gene_type:complete